MAQLFKLTVHVQCMFRSLGIIHTVQYTPHLSLVSFQLHALYTCILSLLIGECDHTQMIDAAAVSEVCQKLSVSSDEVLYAVRSGDGSNPLTIAYELVRDNRYSIYKYK